tara:strand:+ start:282 stop:1457 length:1176 start_codon:yes stop_codon:yes gene_type:complete
LNDELHAFETSYLFDFNFEYPSDKDITVNRGGTSSGKTYSILQALILICHSRPGSVVTVVGQDIPNLKKGAIRDAMSIIKSSKLVQSIIKYYNRSDRIIHFHNGSIIEFNSYDDEQDAKNGKRDYAFFNEANGIKYEIFEAIYVRTRLHTWIDFNPSGEFWLSEKGVENRPNVRKIVSTFEHNPFLEDSIINKIKSYEPTEENIAAGTADEYRWKVYGLGQYAPLEGAIIKRWKLGTFDDSLPCYYGLDWGYTDPFALVKIAVNEKKRLIYVKQLAYVREQPFSNIIDLVASNVHKNDVLVCDSSEPANIRELNSMGFNAYPAFKKPGIVKQRLGWLQDYMIVLDDSPDIEREIKNYVWADKKSETPVDKWNHSIDALSYAYTWYKFNVLR